MIKVAASILSADFLNLGAEIDRAADAGADWLHFDVMDGMFVPNISFGPTVLEAAVRSGRLPCDVHLMIEAPERYVETFAKAARGSLPYTRRPRGTCTGRFGRSGTADV
jgi:ribulose-phosphate 3-epimerase